MKKTAPIFILALLLVCLLSSCGPIMLQPEIEESEFTFSVTYEWNGETTTVSGTYVCEYVGTNWALDEGYYIEWSAYIQGGMEAYPELGATEDGGTLALYLGLSPAYFMGDPDGSLRGAPEPRLTVTHRNGEELSILNDAATIEETYGAKIISYTYDTPIANTFGLFQ